MRNEQDKDQQLDQAIAGLPKELLPEQDLWLQLEPRLQQLKQHSTGNSRFGVIGRALAAAALVGVIGVLMWRSLLIPADNDNQLADNSDIEWMIAEQVMVEEFETIKAEKLGNVGTVSEYFGDWNYQLAVWDEAISQVREALHYYPEEPVLWSQMQNLYQQQLGYLQLISAVDTDEFSWMGNEP